MLLVEKNDNAGGKAMSLSRHGYTHTAWVVIGAPVEGNFYEKILKELEVEDLAKLVIPGTQGSHYKTSTGKYVRLPEMPEGQGTDLNLAMPDSRDQDQPVAELLAPNGLRLRMWSDQPGLQVYTGHGLPRIDGAHEGQRIAPYAGLALEPQGFPDAVNQPAFPSVIVTPDRPYRQRLTVEIMEVPQ